VVRVTGIQLGYFDRNQQSTRNKVVDGVSIYNDHHLIIVNGS
jgi:hypothetical protein